MAGLYSDKGYKYEDLFKQYKGFTKPSYKIKIGSDDLAADLGYYIESVDVVQTIEAKSGSCSFKIINAYDVKKRKFTDKIKSKMMLGTPVEAYLGYNKQTMIFKGYIADISFEFGSGETPSITVMCLDIRALMLNGKMQAMPPESTFKKITDMIIKDYSISKKELDYPGDSDKPQEQNSGDFNFIYKYAVDRGYDFFVLGDTVYMKKKKAYKTPVITLSWGESILSINQSFSYNIFELAGSNAEKLSKDPFAEKKKTENRFKTKAVTNKPVNINDYISDAQNASDLKKRLEEKAKKADEKAASGTVSCVGLPEITPGRFIEIKNLDDDFFKEKYYINRVNHKYSGSGYVTTIYIN